MTLIYFHHIFLSIIILFIILNYYPFCIFLKLQFIDELFDRMNSMSVYAARFKAPISRSSYNYVKSRLLFIYSRLQEVEIRTVIKGQVRVQKMMSTPKKTCLFGFLIAIRSVIDLSSQLLFREHILFTHFLMYRIWQDNIELFFGLIRKRGGFNNNSQYMTLIYFHPFQILFIVLHIGSLNCFPSFLYKLISDIVDCYLKIRLHYYAKIYTLKSTKKQIRQKLTKLMQHSHQQTFCIIIPILYTLRIDKLYNL